jgi:hypothetical protein
LDTSVGKEIAMALSQDSESEQTNIFSVRINTMYSGSFGLILSALQPSKSRSQHLKRSHARRLLALARASRDAARAKAVSTHKHLKEVRKAAELLRVQEAIVIAKWREADQQIGAIRGALDVLNIPEVSLSDNEGDGEDEHCDQVLPLPSPSDSDLDSEAESLSWLSSR